MSDDAVRDTFDGDPVAGYAVKIPMTQVTSHARLHRGDIVEVVVRAEVIKPAPDPIFDDEWLMVWVVKVDLAAVVVGEPIVTNLLDAAAEERRVAAEQKAGIQRLPEADDVIADAQAEIAAGLATMHAVDGEMVEADIEVAMRDDDAGGRGGLGDMTDEEWEKSK